MREMPMKFVFDEMVQPYVADQHCSITGSNATNVIYEGLYLSLLNCGWNSNRQMDTADSDVYICVCVPVWIDIKVWECVFKYMCVYGYNM